MSERNTKLLLIDILASSEKIIRYTRDLAYEQFAHDEKTMDAVIRNFEIIGEAANRLSDDLKETVTSVDWFMLRGFRNRIVHDYMGIDYKIVWNIITSYLPTLKLEIERVIDNI